MGFSYRYSLVVELPPSTPHEVLDWLRESIDGSPIEPGFPMSDLTRDLIEDVPLLLEHAGRLDRKGHGSDGWSHELAVQAPNLHDDSVTALYGLAMLVAPFAPDGVIAVAWTDMLADMSVTIFYVQDGVAFVGTDRDPPIAAVADPDAAPTWRG